MLLRVSQSTEKTCTGYPQQPKLKDREGSMWRPCKARMAWGTVYVMFNIKTAVLMMELKAWVLAIYSRP